ncbi:MAG: metal-sensing transcriptional repressor [Oscillospiraceae bacterium]|jgi:DNA-binding FrmR family transcriptional regulator|nr:metal-sensing transcriptional repressor [Oscillospiraceae bacterium]
MRGDEHEHENPDEHKHEHEHEHDNMHTHAHTHTETKRVLNRLARLTGHLKSVSRMVEDGRDCSEVLLQIAAVRSALTGVSKIILKDHIKHCLADAAATGDMETFDMLNDAIEKFL